MNWKLKQVLIAVIVIFVIEALLQKGSYSVLDVLISTVWGGLAAYPVLVALTQ